MVEYVCFNIIYYQSSFTATTTLTTTLTTNATNPNTTNT